MKIHIIVGWAGIGKTYAAANYNILARNEPFIKDRTNFRKIYHTRLIDFDSGVWKQNRPEFASDPNWYLHYVNELEEMFNWYGGTLSTSNLIVMISSHPDVINTILERGYKLTIMRPSWASRRLYIDRLFERSMTEVPVGPHHRAFMAYKDKFPEFYRAASQLAKDHKDQVKIINMDFRKNKSMMSDFIFDIIGG